MSQILNSLFAQFRLKRLHLLLRYLSAKLGQQTLHFLIDLARSNDAAVHTGNHGTGILCGCWSGAGALPA